MTRALEVLAARIQSALGAYDWKHGKGADSEAMAKFIALWISEPSIQTSLHAGGGDPVASE